MAKQSGQVTLRGRFRPGDVVRLVKVAGPHVLRPEGGEEIEVQSVGEEKDAPRVGYVRFTKGVEVGERYFITGQTGGYPLEVRVTGRAADDPSEVFEQAPVQPDRVRLSDGSFLDDPPTKESAPHILAAQADIRHAKKGTVLRSDTPRGEAHPVDVERPEPIRPQEDVPDGTVQMSDTKPREVDGETVGGGGEATEIVLGPQRQEDVPKGTLQRSDTPTGVAQPIPAGDAVHQAEVRESSAARESRGDPARASAEPLEIKGAKVGAPTGASEKESEKRHEELRESEREAALRSADLDQPGDQLLDTSGFDAQGQPASEDVARASGVEPAEKARVDAPGPDTAPSIKERGDNPFQEDEESKKRSEAGKKAARTRKRNERKAEKSGTGSGGSSSGSESSSGAEKSAKSTEKGSTSRTQTGAATTSNTTAKE